MPLSARSCSSLFFLACITLTACKYSSTSTSTNQPAGAPGNAAAYSISGTVSGAAGTSLKLMGATTLSTFVDSNGNYIFQSTASGDYTLAPSRTGYVFNPVSRAVNLGTSSLKGVDFSAVASTALTYIISGTVSGGVAAGVVITLNGVNVGSAMTDLGGNYTFSDLLPGTHTVSASLPGYTFTAPIIVTLGTSDSAANDFVSTAVPAGGNLPVLVLNPLPQATVGTAYSSSVIKSITGGTAPYHYVSESIATGSPPQGMILNPNGTLTGTAQAAGNYGFNVCAIDSVGAKSSPCKATLISVVSNAPPPSGTSWVYHNGQFDWPGDYSFQAKPNYADTTGAPLSGSYDIKVTLTQAWGGWLPYAQNWAFNSAPYTKLTFALKPTVANQTWQVYFVKVGDIPVGISQDVANYGPAPVVGQWNTYTVPLADLGVLGTTIYKFAIQDQTGLSGNSWYVDNVGFVP